MNCFLSRKSWAIGAYLLVFLFQNCQNPNRSESFPIVRNNPSNAPQLEHEPESKPEPEPQYVGLSVDLLNEFLKKKSPEITVILFKLDKNWHFNGKKTPESGEIWVNKKYGQELLKLSAGEIAYMDFSEKHMDNYNFLKKAGAFQNEDKSLGISYFNYQNRFIQWKKLNQNSHSGSIINVNDLDAFGK